MDDIFEAATRQAMLVRTGASAAGLSNGTINGRSTLGHHGAAGGIATGGHGLEGDRRKSSMLSGGNWDEKGGNMGGNSSKGCCIVV